MSWLHHAEKWLTFSDLESDLKETLLKKRAMKYY